MTRQIPRYESSSDSNVDAEHQINQISRKRKRNLQWVNLATYKSKHEAIAAIEAENQWSYHYSNNTYEGKKAYYRCKSIQRRKEQCNAALYLFYNATNQDVVLFKTRNDHEHNSENLSKTFISNEIKMEIDKMLGLKMKPKSILRSLLDDEREIKMSQLRNYIATYKKNKFGTTSISLGELEQWCMDKSNIPENEDESYVVNYNVIYCDDIYESNPEKDEHSTFKIFISTKRLLNMAPGKVRLHVDATYKLNWEGFPVLIIGTTDMDRHFHVFGMALCSNEKTEDFKFIFQSINHGLAKLNQKQFQPEVLIADGAISIRHAFFEIFGNKDIVMCWAHMRRNVVKRIEAIVKKDSQKEIIDDIDTLQLCQNEKIFKKASDLFIKKWRKQELEFITYFATEWLESKETWYGGYRHFTPCTNNSLESFNKVVKDEDTYRERIPLSRFRGITFEIVAKWSRDYKNDIKIYITVPTINLDLWTKGYQWAISDKSVIAEEVNGTINYFVPGKGESTIRQLDIDNNKHMIFNTFDQFRRRAFKIYTVTMPDDKEKWPNAMCDCYFFFKEYICKHIIGLELRMKYCKAPPAVKSIPIGEKRKRGRPKKATKALLKI